MFSEPNCLCQEELKFKEKKKHLFCRNANSFIPVLDLALLPLIPMFLCTSFARILTEHQLKQAGENI